MKLTGSHEKILAQMRQIALKHPEKIRIVETNVNAEVQLEFYSMMQDVDKSYHDMDLPEIFAQLSDCDDIQHRKKLLVAIASTGEIEAYRFLEKYLETCDDDIKKWALLACQQCQMFLESSLLDESKIYVASGLGGKDHRLRYIFVLAGKKKEPFSDFEKKVMENEAKYYLEKSDSVCETIQYDGNYAICTALVPLHEDIVELVQSIIDEVNQYGGFIMQSIFITNEKLVSREALDKMFDSDENS